MKIKKFNELNEGVYKDMNERDLKGGITNEEYDQIIKFVKDLDRKSDIENPWNRGETLSDEEKVISEILLMITKNYKNETFDFNTYYHRRLGFIKANKNKNIKDLE